MEMWAEDKNGDLVPTTDPDSAVVTDKSLGEDTPLDLSLKHDAALCVKADCEICKPTGRLKSDSELDYQREICP